MISPVCLVFSKRLFLQAQEQASTEGQERRAYYLGINVALLAQSIPSWRISSSGHALAQTTEWPRPSWGISVAPLAAITADEQWAIATCYACSYYCYCGCYCLYRDHHRGWAAILSGDQLTAGVQAGQSSCSLWWSGCNATTPATSQMFLDFYRVYGCFSLKREKGKKTIYWFSLEFNATRGRPSAFGLCSDCCGLKMLDDDNK